VQFRDIHLLRGVAIVLVVMVHCAQILTWPADDWRHELTNISLGDVSGVFFIVAGYLFHHLSPRFEYKEYLWRKFTNVVLPFIILSIPGILHTVGYLDLPRQHPELVGLPKWMVVAFLYAYPGEQYNFPLWFIPVMATYFVVAPVFIWLLRKPSWFLAALGVFCLYSLLTARPPVTKYQHVNLLMYWLSSYMIGMAASLFRERVCDWVDKNHLALWLAWVAIVYVQFAWLDDGNTQRFQIEAASDGPILNLFFVQKAVLFFALLASFRILQHQRLLVLDMLATWSFPIFFVHAYFMKIIFDSKFGFDLLGTVMNLLVVSLLVAACSLILALLTRKVFGKGSRYIIGN
jgi:probable poly-beta-1,6-N-acetyl-D-glucosamine export protein